MLGPRDYEPQHSHDNCRWDVCQEANIDYSDYEARHVSKDCDCRDFAISIEVCVEEILEHSRMPNIVLMSARMKDRQYRAQREAEFGSGISRPGYVTVSHVWLTVSETLMATSFQCAK